MKDHYVDTSLSMIATAGTKIDPFMSSSFRTAVEYGTDQTAEITRVRDCQIFYCRQQSPCIVFGFILWFIIEETIVSRHTRAHPRLTSSYVEFVLKTSGMSAVMLRTSLMYAVLFLHTCAHGRRTQYIFYIRALIKG